MAIGNESRIIFWRICSFPYQFGYKILTSENFLTDFFKILLLVIINGNEDNAIFGQQVTSNFQTWIYHIEPISMEATIAFSITLHWVNKLVTFFIEGTTGRLEVFASLGEIVVIDEVIAGVIRRVYVNHLDSAKIVLAENFEHIKIIALDI